MAKIVRPPLIGQHVGVEPDHLRELLAAAGEGDDHAFALLVRATSEALLRFCERVGPAHAAEDMVQETYLRAVRSAAAFRGDSAVRTWLMGIARHVCADELRRTRRARRTLRALVSTRVPRHGASSTESSWVDIDDQLLSGLGREQREAFVLTRLMGWSYVEAAEALDCPVGTVRSRVARARAQLADVNRAWEAG